MTNEEPRPRIPPARDAKAIGSGVISGIATLGVIALLALAAFPFMLGIGGPAGLPDAFPTFGLVSPTTPPTAFLVVDPPSAAVGETVSVAGVGFWPDETVVIFVDSGEVTRVRSSPDGRFRVGVAVPDIAFGEVFVTAVGLDSGQRPYTTFIVAG